MQKLTCILIVIFILVFQTSLFARSFFELDVHYGFGTSELSFNSVPGFGFSFYPIKNFGVSTGVEYSWRWQTETGSLRGSTPAVDYPDNDPFIFNYAVKKYEEEWRGRILQIPLLLKYSDDFYYAAAGMKIGVPQSAGTDISYRGLETWGYYPEYDLLLTAPDFQGFGSQKDGSAKTKILNIKNLIMLAAEGGVRYKLNDNFSLLAGVFVDYSLNNGFDRALPPVIERIQKIGNADVVAHDTWKSWHPWSVGVAVKFAFSFGFREERLPPVADTTVYEDPNITVLPDSLQPPVPVWGFDPQFEDFIPIIPLPVPSDYTDVPPLPGLLMHKEADFIFDYPEARTSPNYSPHNILISQIADAIRAKPSLQLHCVGYSEKLASEFFAYETAFQRALRIRHILSRLYGIDEGSIFIYSQGSNNSSGSNSAGYRRVECFLIDTD
ncbi:MAG: hypothetical protein FWF67_02145 [Fibromonadales bacterium]|nr:hypothetical protein [Fibromonadales bacterium]